MKILSIGNSFSQDAHAYIHDVAKSMGLEIDCLNLYIGGCSLETHTRNLKENARAYTPEKNGTAKDTLISIKDALTAEKYDIITLQQASHDSGKKETYFPYLTELYDACMKYQPESKIFMQQTWAYEIDSTHAAFPDYKCDQKYMYERLNDAYSEAADKLGVELIPVGGCVEYFRSSVPEFDYKNGGLSLTRDGFHLSIPLGRLLAAYVWIEKLTGENIEKSDFIPQGCDNISLNLIPTVRDNVRKYMQSIN